MSFRPVIAETKVRHLGVFGIAAGLLLSGCSNAAKDGVAAPDWAVSSEQAFAGERAPLAEQLGTFERTPDATRVAAPTQGCLAVVWDVQDRPDRAFDMANDNAEGGAISCATQTSASQFEAALAEIRTAAMDKDRAGLLRQVNSPLMFIDLEGTRHVLEQDELADTGFERVFTPDVIDTLTDLHLEDMTVVPGQGGYFELGSIWLVAMEQGSQPRLITVNRQALREAAEAAEAASRTTAPDSAAD